MNTLKLIFFCFAAIIGQSSATPTKTIVVAHRGASGLAPENTIPAFELAWKQGADAIEADFRITKDGHIICIHDEDTKKVAGKNLIVKDSTLEQLRQLDVGAKKAKQYTGTKIPTMQEVFATIPTGKKIYIELKSGKEIIPSLLKEIKQSKLNEDQITIISFNPLVLEEIRKQLPTIRLNWLVSFKRNLAGNYKPKPSLVYQILKSIKANGLSTSQNHVNRHFIEYIQKQGYEHHVWTINDAKSAKKFQQWGTHSITTDYPGTIKKSLFPIEK